MRYERLGNFPKDSGFALKTWKYVKDGAGKPRIVLHHSPLPYSGN